MYSCNGNGALKVESCTACGGRGMHVQVTQGMQTFMMCNNCGGSGQIRVENCGNCGGVGLKKIIESLDIKITKGVTEGSKLVITNAGNDVVGANRGDIFLTIKVIPNTKYELDGLNISQTEELSFIDMVFGKEVEIKTLAGSFKITIPTHCEVNKIFRLRGQGVKDDETNTVGDLYVKVVPKIPKQISEQERDLLLQLKETSNFS